MKMISVFFIWLWDKWSPNPNKSHMYWYKEPPKWLGVNGWGKVNQIPSSTIALKTFGHQVRRKRCEICDIVFWSNNPKNICGKLGCWIRKENKS